MKKHIIICLPLVFVLASCIQNDKKVADEIPLKKLDNTTWTFQVAENCIDSIKFFNAEKWMYYYCGTGFLYDGNYAHIGDTIYTEILDDVSWVDSSKGQSITCKLDFKYENNQLCVVRKWEEYSMFHHLYPTQCFDISRN